MTTSTASPSPKPLEEAGIEAWITLLEWFALKSQGGWWFRGHAVETWDLQPGIGRTTKTGAVPFSIEDEKAVFSAFELEAARYVDFNGFNRFERLAMAQHFGLPTRLLDWTTNPLVSLWFAIENDKHHGVDGAVHAIRPRAAQIGRDVDPWETATEPVALVQVSSHISRVTAQQGLCTLHADPLKAWSPSHDSGINYQKKIVPAAAKSTIRLLLHQCGVDKGRLMVDIDSLCATLKWRLETDRLLGR